MVKILNVVDGPGWTGGVEQTLLLTRRMRALGIDAHLAAHEKNRVLEESRDAGIPTYAYQGRGTMWSAVWRLNGILKQGFDFAVGHKPAALRDLLIAARVFHGGTRVVGVRRVSFHVPRLTTYRFPHHVVAVGHSVKAVLVDDGLPAEHISVIPSGVDLSRFYADEAARHAERAKRGWSDRLVVLNLAKFIPEQKGQAHLFDALAALRGRYPLVAALAGIHTDEPPAHAMLAERGLAGQVDLLGFRRDIPQLVNACDLFVFPSLPGLDAIAGSVLQAMACGKLVVATAIGSIPEYLRDGENGFLVPPGDSAALTAAMERALALSPQERARMSEAARRTVVAGYSVEAMTDAYVALFSRMARETKKSAGLATGASAESTASLT